MAAESHARFVWFWTFWHWSRESYESGELLRDPLQAVGSNWDEWFHHEASAEDRQRIAAIGGNGSAQTEFVSWLFSRWAAAAEWKENRSIARFVAGQLAHVAPFDQWPAFADFRARYGVEGPAAVVLTEQSAGEAADVRAVEALVLPVEPAVAAKQPVVTEGFQADEATVAAPRAAALTMLGGTGLWTLLALWFAAGKRPYAPWLRNLLGVGWVVAAGLILFLLYGPELNQQLEPVCLALVALWTALTATGVVTGGLEAVRAWLAARRLRRVLTTGQVRLRMNGGLTVQGGSAGLAFCLNLLLSLYRAQPQALRQSSLWRRFFERLEGESGAWAATGCVTPGAWIKPVVLGPKVRACAQNARIAHLLTPWQRHGALPENEATVPSPSAADAASAPTLGGGIRLGFAAETPRTTGLRRHRSIHLATAMTRIGQLLHGGQLLVNLGALAVTAVMIAAAPDLRAILLPPAAPLVVPPVSPSPYAIWVSLDTNQPKAFEIVFESKYWASRRAHVAAQDKAPASMRAEIRLLRVARPVINDVEDGTIWIERRRCFLYREFEPGERVGRYSLSFLFALGHHE